MTAKAVAIQGALNVDNFGDVLLGRIYTDLLSAAGATTAAPRATAVVARQIDNLTDLDRMPAQPQALVYIGGGYFGEPHRSLAGRWRWGFRMMRYHLDAAKAFLQSRRPIAVFGVGVGPISNLLARRGVVRLLNRAACVVLRDEESLAHARRYGVTTPITVAPDIVLSMTAADFGPDFEQGRDWLRANAQGKPVLALHLDQQGASPEQWQQMLAQLARRFRDRSDLRLLLLKDQANTPVTLTQDALYASLQQLGGAFADAQLYTYTSVDHLAGVVSACDAVLTTKLHVGIVSAALRRPTFALPCHPKSERFYRQIGASEHCLPMTRWNEPSLDRLFDLLERFTPLPSKPLEAAVDAARATRGQIAAFMASLPALAVAPGTAPSPRTVHTHPIAPN